ncbi:hypothetical protein POF50_021870 [Streptomyces sp. SL13]|uniref:Lysyl-tRNA synthetase N-terminal transmembrane region domain-containing protein n=1 Tax=Streptantibioticus silvisoli TaxID=2705255 RepID=A0AA90H6P6_9ACTN|nr:hypothetical protein [Streptantibioticus silvisoli]MDI5971950.1 hypothetical protein [Streptantibioticus silvisoli]
MSGGRRTDGGSGGRTARHGPLGAAWRRAADRVPVWLGGFFGLLGAVCALSALIAPLRHAIAPALRFVGAWLVPASPNLAHAVFLLLSAAMLARKRAAWWVVTFYVALVLLAEALTVTMVGVTGSAVSLAVTAAVLAVLVAGRGHFPARVRRGAFWRALGVLVAGPAVGVAAGWALVAAFHDGLPARQWLLWSANRVLGGLTSTRRFGGRPPQAIDFPLGLFGALALLNAARALFRSQRARAAGRRRRGPAARAAGPARRPGLPGLLRHPARQGRRLRPGGPGLGVDRLIMFLTGLPIRETLPFPLVRGQ